MYNLSEAVRISGFSRQTLKKMVDAGTLIGAQVSVPWDGTFRSEYRIRADSLEALQSSFRTRSAQGGLNRRALDDIHKRLADLESRLGKLEDWIKP